MCCSAGACDPSAATPNVGQGTRGGPALQHLVSASWSGGAMLQGLARACPFFFALVAREWPLNQPRSLK